MSTSAQKGVRSKSKVRRRTGGGVPTRTPSKAAEWDKKTESAVLQAFNIRKNRNSHLAWAVSSGTAALFTVYQHLYSASPWTAHVFGSADATSSCILFFLAVALVSAYKSMVGYSDTVEKMLKNSSHRKLLGIDSFISPFKGKAKKSKAGPGGVAGRGPGACPRAGPTEAW